MSQLIHSEITGKVIGAALEVWKVLGYGFLEKVYENSLVEESKRIGLRVQQQFGIEVLYKEAVVGQYAADLFVEEKVLVELKSEKEFNSKHEVQLLNYLKATGVHVGLLFNFGEKKCEWKRLVM